LNPNFLLVHRNRYSEGMDEGQKTPPGHPDFNSYVKILRVLVFIPDGWADRQMDRDINLVWASLTMFLRVKNLPVDRVSNISGEDRPRVLQKRLNGVLYEKPMPVEWTQL
jgi:hypothetical protein